MTKPQLHKDLIDREPEGEYSTEEDLWSSQYIGPITIGGDTVYIDREALDLTEEQVDYAIEQGLVRSIPADVYLRNRGNTPISTQVDYDDIQQELKVELKAQDTPVLSLPEAVSAWSRYTSTLLRDPSKAKKLRGLANLALVVGIQVLLLLGILWWVIG